MKFRENMIKEKLTDRQKAIFEYIRDKIINHGTSPTIREIGEKFNISSTNGVRQHLNAIIRKGYLKKHEFISRGLELTQRLAADVGLVKLVGSVPAGSPIDAIENIEGEIALDTSFLPKGESFTLTVKGDSMKDAGIFDGDLILVQKQQVAQKGEIVVALIGGEATVKRYFPENKRIRLQPENDDFDPIYIDKKSDEFRIAGKVVGLLRRF
ncbi:MAG: transcriptional repressor LexA [candidate division Zixibacteria bacterium]|nr:transcriptional repressor LexA [candidate division Zixibacteria bacterium]